MVYVWSYTTGDEVWSSPAVANGRVYVGSDDNEIYAFGVSSGTSAISQVLTYAIIIVVIIVLIAVVAILYIAIRGRRQERTPI